MDEKGEKLDWSLFTPGIWSAIEDVLRVMIHGLEKYPRDNWVKYEGFTRDTVTASLMRHVTSYIKGFDLDKYSGLPHLAHACCNILFLLSGEMAWQRREKERTPSLEPFVALGEGSVPFAYRVRDHGAKKKEEGE